jgi:hypothetical protein
MAKKQTDNEMIDEILSVTPLHDSELPEPTSESVEGVLGIVEEVKAKNEHPLLRYHYKGRSINQLAGMFMISEAEVKKIIAEHENL